MSSKDADNNSEETELEKARRLAEVDQAMASLQDKGYLYSYTDENGEVRSELTSLGRSVMTQLNEKWEKVPTEDLVLILLSLKGVVESEEIQIEGQVVEASKLMLDKLNKLIVELEGALAKRPLE